MSTTRDARRTRGRAAPDEEVSGWAVGLSAFAGILMVMLGGFHIFAGIAGIANGDFFVVGANFTYDVDATTWGWINLIGGAVVLAAGFGVLAGQLWARVIGIGLAVLSAVSNFLFMPYYPLWSIVMVTLDIAVIWALMVYGRREAEGY
jgi:hypothetical protein